MIDLHTHTGDGGARQKLETLLQRAEEKKLTHLAISDHEGVGAYPKLKDPVIRGLFSGHIIPAVELRFINQGVRNEMLGYGIDTDKMAQSKLISRENLLRGELIELEQYHKLFADLGLEVTDLDELRRQMITLEQSGADHETIRRVTGTDFFSDRNQAIREKLLKPYNGSFKIYATEKLKIDWSYQPTMEEVSDEIRNAGGFAFMAHPARVAKYSGDDAMVRMLDYGTSKGLLDGVEVYRPDASPKQIAFLRDYGRRHKLLIGAGSDSSKEKEPLLDGIGKEHVGNWIDDVQRI